MVGIYCRPDREAVAFSEMAVPPYQTTLQAITEIFKHVTLIRTSDTVAFLLKCSEDVLRRDTEADISVKDAVRAQGSKTPWRFGLCEVRVTSRHVADKTSKVIDYFGLGSAQTCIP